MEYSILPVPKPRQTRRDKWLRRPCVMRYRDFADRCRELGVTVPVTGSHITFVMPIPAFISKKKRLAMVSSPHTIKPDLDNLIKALFDATFENDSVIWDYRATKIWGEEGKIIIEP